MRSIANIIPQFVKNISLGRFIVAIALAIIVWGYVIVSQYPERTLPPYEVPISETVPPPADAQLEIVPSENPVTTVSVTLSGPVDTVTNVTLGQIKPYIDLSQCRSPGSCFTKIGLRPGLPDNVSYKIVPDSVSIALEGKITKTLPVEVVKSGEVTSDYTLENDALTVNPNQVTISGRQSLVDRAVKAQVTVQLTGRVGLLRDTTRVTLLDSQSKPITDTSLTISPSLVSVAGNIIYKLAPRTIPIRVVTTGEPAPGFIAGNAQATPLLATVVSGNQDTLSKLEFVSTEPVNINGASSTVSTTVRLQGIPDVTYFGSDQVQVNIGIVPFQTSKTISVRVGVANQASNLRYSLEPTSVNLTISGPYQAFQPDLPLDQIKATVNVQDRGAGSYTLPVQVELPSNLVVTNSPTVKLLVFLPPTPTATATLAPLPTATPSPTVRIIPPTNTPVVPPGTTTPSANRTPGASTAPSTVGPTTVTTPPPASTTTPAATVAAATQTPPTTVAVGQEKQGISTSPDQTPQPSLPVSTTQVVSTTLAVAATMTVQPQRFDGLTPVPSTKQSVALLIQAAPPPQPYRNYNLL